MIVGISGPSCSGKTSLAKELAALLGAPMLHLDQYFIADATRPIVMGHPSFEQPHQYDGAAMLRDAIAAAKTSEHLVLEGFLLFTYPGFLDLVDRAVHLDVPHHVLAARRADRNGATGDVKGGRIKLADTAWAAHGEAEWATYGKAQADLPGVEVVTPHVMRAPSTARDIAIGLLAAWGVASTR